MNGSVLTLDDDLLRTSRMPALAGAHRDTVRPLELAALAAAGVVASLLTNLLRLHLGIPGSSIVFAAFPIALGFALVPRRGAGGVMGGAALVTTVVLWLAGTRIDGVGAQTSLVLTGPLLDVALHWAHTGWRVYIAFIVACAASNCAAFIVRAATKGMGLAGMGGGRPFAPWWSQAVVTYAIAGVVAGIISAAAWFQLRERRAAASAAMRE